MGVIRFGIVGCGYFGGELARILNKLDQAEVKAVYGGSRAPLLAKELQCRYEKSLESLVGSSDIDAVVVASPNNAHREPVIRAAESGKHVYCEKPIALTLRDCDEMLKACREANVTFMAGHLYYFMHGLRKVKEWVENEVIGKPIIVHSERTGWEEKQENVSWKKKQRISGGHLFHHIHELDFLQYIMGPAEAVCTAGGRLVHKGDGYGDEDDVLLLTLQFGQGTVGSMQYGSAFRWGSHFIKINGTCGAILIDMENSKIYLKKGNEISEHSLNGDPDFDRERASFYRKIDGGVAYGTEASQHLKFALHMMEQEMRTFIDAILGRSVDEYLHPLFNGIAARSSVATAEAALRSLEEKRWIYI